LVGLCDARGVCVVWSLVLGLVAEATRVFVFAVNSCFLRRYIKFLVLVRG